MLTLAALGVSACGRRATNDVGRDSSPEVEVFVAKAPVPSHPCRSPSGCAAEEYCAFEPGLCGRGERAGTCRARPRTCEGRFAPVCGCDGVVYEDECAAHRRGVDLSVTGGCKANVVDFVPCGARYCDARREYCEIVLSDVFELPTDYACRPLPSACMPTGGVAKSCDCFPKGTRCLSFCGTLESAGVSGFHLTCRL